MALSESTSFNRPTNPSRGSARRLVLGAVGLFLVSVLTGGSVAWFSHPRPGPQAAPTVTEATSESPPAVDPTVLPTNSSATTPASAKPTRPSKAEVETTAYRELERRAARDLRRVKLRGEIAAQLSSKYVGVKDPRQRTASGSHTFRAVDILAEHQMLRRRYQDTYKVLLLRGQDFYPHTTTSSGKTFWYTFVLGGFGSKSEAADFCTFAYPGRTGEALNNVCLPKELKR